MRTASCRRARGRGWGVIKGYTVTELFQEVERRDAELLANATASYELAGEPLQVIEQFGTWAVTDYGIECLERYYVIEKQRLHENDWPLHMSEKTWVDMYDFLRAFYAGRCYHYPKRYRHPYDKRTRAGGRS
jgi:hypothetical protein